MTKLTTHVLDIYSGKPGKGIKVDLFYINNKKELEAIFGVPLLIQYKAVNSVTSQK